MGSAIVCIGPCSQKMVEFKEGQDFQPYCLKEGVKQVIEQHIADHYNSLKINKKN